jgi:acyl-[acyl-carrier-protein]-phospholipid O-acyltransferase / long-chain-fatty-acid--[acyl-carrier-protein] ligase
MFLNAFTDVGHKIIIQNTIFKVYDNQEQIILIAIVNALILLPFILLFTPSSYLATKYSKDKIMRYSAAFAVLITLIITFCYYMGFFETAFVMTFILSLQSAIYSPAKYGYIKELVGHKHISAGNAAVQSVTTVAILGAIIFYSVLFQGAVEDNYHTKHEILEVVAPFGWLLVIGSIIEFIFTLYMPKKEPASPHKKFDIKKYKSGYYLKKNIVTMKRKKDIYVAIISLSVLWAISQVMLAAFGAYAKETLGVTNVILVQGVMALAAIGIVVGSIISARVSKHYIHMGLVVIGFAGISLSLFLLTFMESMTLIAVLFSMFGFFAGFVLVAFNAYIQDNSSRAHLATILAGNNFMQNIFMFSFLVLTTLFAYMGVDSVHLFYIMLGVSLIMFVYLFKRYELDFYWSIVEISLRLRYKFVFSGVENIPQKGSVLMLSNHISWIDWAILQFPLQRRIRYIMERSIYLIPGMHYVLKLGHAIPISSHGAKDAIKVARDTLARHDMIVLFPEGHISYDGEYGEFSKGFELIARRQSGHIICVNIDGLYGSILSRSPKHFTAKSSWLRRVVHVNFSKPLPINSSVEEVEKTIKDLRDVQ